MKVASMNLTKGWTSFMNLGEQTKGLATEEVDALPSKYKETIAEIVNRAKWVTVVATTWQFQEDNINLLEAQAVLLAIRWLVETRQVIGHRQCLLVDNSAVLGALIKGRSSVKRMNHLCRRIAALLLGAGIMPYWVWVPSELNPADGPSRGILSTSL